MWLLSAHLRLPGGIVPAAPPQDEKGIRNKKRESFTILRYEGVVSRSNVVPFHSTINAVTDLLVHTPQLSPTQLNDQVVYGNTIDGFVSFSWHKTAETASPIQLAMVPGTGTGISPEKASWIGKYHCI